MNTFMSAEEALNISKKNGYEDPLQNILFKIQKEIEKEAKAGNVYAVYNLELSTCDMKKCKQYFDAIIEEIRCHNYDYDIDIPIFSQDHNLVHIPITIFWCSTK